MEALFFLTLALYLVIFFGSLSRVRTPKGDRADAVYFVISSGALLLLFLNVDNFFQGVQSCSTP